MRWAGGVIEFVHGAHAIGWNADPVSLRATDAPIESSMSASALRMVCEVQMRC